MEIHERVGKDAVRRPRLGTAGIVRLEGVVGVVVQEVPPQGQVDVLLVLPLLLPPAPVEILAEAEKVLADARSEGFDVPVAVFLAGRRLAAERADERAGQDGERDEEASEHQTSRSLPVVGRAPPDERGGGKNSGSQLDVGTVEAVHPGPDRWELRNFLHRGQSASSSIRSEGITRNRADPPPDPFFVSVRCPGPTVAHGPVLATPLGEARVRPRERYAWKIVVHAGRLSG